MASIVACQKIYTTVHDAPPTSYLELDAHLDHVIEQLVRLDVANIHRIPTLKFSRGVYVSVRAVGALLNRKT